MRTVRLRQWFQQGQGSEDAPAHPSQGKAHCGEDGYPVVLVEEIAEDRVFGRRCGAGYGALMAEPTKRKLPIGISTFL